MVCYPITKVHFDSTLTSLNKYMAESHTQPNTSSQSFKSKIKQIQGQTLMAETWQTSQPKSKYLQGPHNGRIIGMQASSMWSSTLRRLQANGAPQDEWSQVLIMVRTWSSRSNWSLLIMLLVNLLVSMDGPSSSVWCLQDGPPSLRHSKFLSCNFSNQIP